MENKGTNWGCGISLEALEHQDEMFVAFRPDGTRTHVNGAYRDYYHLTRRQCIGSTIFDRVAVQDHVIIQSVVRRLTEGQPIAMNEHRAVTLDGTVTWQAWTGWGLRDDGGKLLEVRSIGRDITWLSTDADRDSDRNAELMHDLNNTLTAIGGYTEYLRDCCVTPSQVGRLSALRDAVAQAQGIASFRRIGVPHATRKRTRLNEVAIRAIQAARVTLPVNIRIETDMTTTVPLWAMVCEVDVQRALSNVIRNGVEAMPQGGTLSVRIRHQTRGSDRRPYALIVFEDTGVGIPPHIASHVFKPAITTKAESGGLGLSIARRVVLEHQGSIEIEPRTPKGTKVTVTLPLADAC